MCAPSIRSALNFRRGCSRLAHASSYLALRIALLECAPEVGTAVPVLADDILVNFDDDRRAGAARALAELAQSRQVIVFTCHKEVVSTFTEQAQNVHVLDI